MGNQTFESQNSKSTINNVCYFLANKYSYSYERVMAAIRDNEYVQPIPIKDNFISILDKTYPSSLHELERPPIHLCYQGNIELLRKPKIAMIGSRIHSSYGAWVVSQLMQRLSKDIVIVSGLAKGIDGIVHWEAIRNGINTIGVIGSGLNTIYPQENWDLFQMMKRDQLILSEYQYDVPVRKHHFPLRNRIIAGLSDVLVVIESKIRSGSATTVTEALALGRDIYCVPHRLSDELGSGNHLMIQEGANVIYDIDEFCREMNVRNDLTNHKIPLR